MYMHAWQSWVWNRAASQRVRTHGADNVVAGDLVLVLQDSQAAQVAPKQDEAVADSQQQQETEGMDADEADAADAASAASRLAAAHIVTAAEAADGRFSVRDVVLPLPGGRVQYPQHDAGWKLYCQLATADGVMLPGMTQEEFDVAAAAAVAGNTTNQTAAAAASHNVRDFQLAGLSGDYRKLLHVPADLAHRVVKYSDPNQDDLLSSDWHELQESQQQQKRQKLDTPAQQTANGKEAANVPAGEGTSMDGVQRAVVADESHDREGLYHGVVLEFMLPSSCYATMLIRELTKSSTSKASHRELTKSSALKAADGELMVDS